MTEIVMKLLKRALERVTCMSNCDVYVQKFLALSFNSAHNEICDI